MFFLVLHYTFLNWGERDRERDRYTHTQVEREREREFCFLEMVKKYCSRRTIGGQVTIYFFEKERQYFGEGQSL